MRRTSHQLVFEYAVDELSFYMTLWYHDCDLLALERRYGTTFMRRVYFHIAAFDMNKFASLQLDTVEFGPLGEFVDEAFADLWSTVVRGVWAQWRFENNLPDAEPPRLDVRTSQLRTTEQVGGVGEDSYLVLSGGGKDSLATLSLLDGCEADYATLGYSSSIYGPAALQHRLIEDVVSEGRPSVHHRLTVYDDFLDSPVLSLQPEFGLVQLTAAETPASVFQALPVILEHGYSDLVLGHERSADVGNLIWAVTGEDVNHQWGKSTEAESRLRDYVCEQLVPGVGVFSVLKPIYDVLIFSLISELPFPSVAKTHSCNVQKPWCRRCPKCVYVWLSFLAYLDAEQVAAMFGEDLFSVEENYDHLFRMAGLSDHTPFECIGQIGEVRLALLLCHGKGLRGPLIDAILDLSWMPEVRSSVAEYTAVDHAYSALPSSLRAPLFGRLDDLGGVAKREIERQLVSCKAVPPRNR